MPKIFISYRRVDTQAMATLIYNRLAKIYCKKDVFLDTKAITSGKWWQQIQNALDDANIVIVVIGPKWEDEIQRRLGTGDDYVLKEVQIAIESDKNILLAFVDGVKGVDSSRLPDEIKSLPEYQGYEIFHEPHFEGSIRVLIDQLPAKSRPCLIAAVFVFLIIGAIAFGIVQSQTKPSTTATIGLNLTETENDAAPASPIGFTLFRGTDHLIVYVPEDVKGSLAGISFSVTERDQVQDFPLSGTSFAAFGGFDFAYVEGPYCFVLERDNSAAILPLQCSTLDSSRRLIQPIASPNIFWLSDGGKLGLFLIIMRDTLQIGQCPGNATSCEIDP